MNNQNNSVNLNSYYMGAPNDNEPPKKPAKKKKNRFLSWWKNLSKRKRISLSILASLLAVFIILGSFIGVYITVILEKLGSDNDFSKLDNDDLGIDTVISKDVFNIALFGVDTRDKGSFSGLSDSIMILSINKTDNELKIISVLRDSLVPIENNGKTSYNKINSAYSIGGPSLAVKTLNTCFGLDISAYATVNFYGMADIIDAVGGIEIEVTSSEIADTYHGINALINEQYINIGEDPTPYFIYKAGTHKVNGMQAVAYARIRKAVNAYGNTNDFGRTERQRVVLKKIMEKALDTDVTSYPSLVNKLTPYIKTSLSHNQMFSMASLLAKKPSLTEARVPHDNYIINADYRGSGASCVYYNYEYAGKLIRAFIYDDIQPEDYMTKNGVDLTGWHTPIATYSATDASAEEPAE